jgi:hypothetical protein
MLVVAQGCADAPRSPSLRCTPATDPADGPYPPWPNYSRQSVNQGHSGRNQPRRGSVVSRPVVLIGHIPIPGRHPEQYPRVRIDVAHRLHPPFRCRGHTLRIYYQAVGCSAVMRAQALLEAGDPGSGLRFGRQCQRAIVTGFREAPMRSVDGSRLTPRDDDRGSDGACSLSLLRPIRTESGHEPRPPNDRDRGAPRRSDRPTSYEA